MKHYLIIFLFLLLACNKEKIKYDLPCTNPTNELLATSALIIGKWEWVSELYRVPFTNEYILKTPQTEGYTRQLNVINDKLTFYKSHVFDQSYRYNFVVESSLTNYPLDSLNVLVFNDLNTGIRTNYTHYKICNDTLILNFQVRSETKGIERWAKVK